MKIKFILPLFAVLLCLSLSSCQLIPVFGGMISVSFETETGTEPFDRSEAYELIPRLDMKYYLSDLSDIYLQNACGIYRAVTDFEEEYAVKGDISRDEAIALFRLIELECPELFQLDGSKSLRIEYTTGNNAAKRVFFDYRMTKDEYTEALSRLEEATGSFLSKVGKLSDYDKEVSAFDYIAKRCTYDENAGFADSAYGSLVLGAAKCDGISRGFQMLCEAAGLPCLMITAEAKDGGVGHAWNMVKLGGGYYNVDLTQSVRSEENSESSEIIYYYFNVADKWMSENYERYNSAEIFGPLPVCDTFDQSYYAQLGGFVREGGESWSVFTKGMHNAVTAKKNRPFYMQFESAKDAADFSKDLKTKVALWAAEHGGVSSVEITACGDRMYKFKIKRG